MLRFATSTLVAVTTIFLASRPVTWANNCWFTSYPSTLCEQTAGADAIVLAEYVSGKQPHRPDLGNSVYRIKQVAQNKGSALSIGDMLTIPRYQVSDSGELYLLFARRRPRQDNLEWYAPIKMTEVGFDYIIQAPPTSLPVTQRLEYFLPFLESHDKFIAHDAHAEVASASYSDIAGLRDKLSADRIRKWVASPDTPPQRIRTYGVLLGYCGTAEDVKLLESKILEEVQDYRMGMEGVMFGYLMLAGDDGLQVIEQSKLNNEILFRETYAAMQAIEFMWYHGDGRIERERLRQSMRILLDRPGIADLVIAVLARWNDWSIQEWLMTVYGQGEYDERSIRRAIVHYMHSSAKDLGEPLNNRQMPEHVQKAEKHLAELSEKDPATVREVERFRTFLFGSPRGRR